MLERVDCEYHARPRDDRTLEDGGKNLVSP